MLRCESLTKTYSSGGRDLTVVKNISFSLEPGGFLAIVGPFLSDFLRGGAEFGSTTLSRFYAIHMLLVPGGLIAMIGAHLYLVTRLGTTAPPWLKARGNEGLREERV